MPAARRKAEPSPPLVAMPITAAGSMSTASTRKIRPKMWKTKV